MTKEKLNLSEDVSKLENREEVALDQQNQLKTKLTELELQRRKTVLDIEAERLNRIKKYVVSPLANLGEIPNHVFKGQAPAKGALTFPRETRGISGVLEDLSTAPNQIKCLLEGCRRGAVGKSAKRAGRPNLRAAHPNKWAVGERKF